jgi:hypothetical protein
MWQTVPCKKKTASHAKSNPQQNKSVPARFRTQHISWGIFYAPAVIFNRVRHEKTPPKTPTTLQIAMLEWPGEVRSIGLYVVACDAQTKKKVGIDACRFTDA